MTKAARPGSKVIVLSIALPFLLLGVAGWGLALYPVVQHLRAMEWQSVPGQLLRLYEDTSERGRTSRLAGEFSYRWQGREYRSTRLYFGVMRDNFDDGWRQRFVDDVGAEGSAINVLVNPNDPASAVAQPAIRWLEVGCGMLGGSMFGIGGVLWLYAARGRRNDGAGRDVAGTVSWPLVLTLLAFSPLWATLAWLLWRDGRPGWSLAATLPVLLALNGVRAGLQQARRRRRSA